MLENIKLIAFDGDDTLWYNEAVYNRAFDIAINIANPHITDDSKNKIFINFNRRLATNVQSIGFGYKTYILTLISFLVENFNISTSKVNLIISDLTLVFQKPVTLYPSVESTIKQLHSQYPLIVITKGETFEQTKKIESSNLCAFFSNIFIVGDKNEDVYKKILTQYIFGWRLSKIGLTDYATMVPITLFIFWTSYIICKFICHL